MTMTDAIKALMDYYDEFCQDKPMEYTYGFMDALSVLREMEEKA